MLALVNSLPTVTSGRFYVVDTQYFIEGNVITKSQVAIATGKNWKVYDYNDYDNIAVEYAGDPGIEINETNFPDNNFRNHVSTSYDTDSDNYLSYEEVAAVTNIDVSNKNIADLKGIEHFTALIALYCYSNQLTALNVSANIALTDLSCYGNQIQGNEMLALVNSLPIVTSGWFYVVDTQNSIEGNVITKSQIAIATGKNWKVYDYNGKNKVEYAGVEEYVLTLGNPTNGTLTATSNGRVGEGTAVILTATPDEGYKLKNLKAYKTGDESQTVAISENKFTMPAFDVTVTAEFEKTATTGLFDVKRESLSAYPNPTTGQLWVSVPELAEGTAAEMHVYNTSGQLLQRVPAHGASAGSAANRLSIDLSGYPAGVYIIRVGNAAAKVVKQ